MWGYLILALFMCGVIFIFLSIISLINLANEHQKWREAYANSKKPRYKKKP